MSSGVSISNVELALDTVVRVDINALGHVGVLRRCAIPQTLA